MCLEIRAVNDCRGSKGIGEFVSQLMAYARDRSALSEVYLIFLLMQGFNGHLLAVFRRSE